MIGDGASFPIGSPANVSPGSMNLSGGFTISAWVNVTNTASGIQTIWANKGTSVSNGFSLYVNGFNTSDQRLEFASGTSPVKATTATNLVTYGQWHHVSAAVNLVSGKATLYVDGVNQTVSSNVAPAIVTQAAMYLGAYAPDASSRNYFKGLMDEARIEKAARSADWIWASYMTSATNSSLATYANVVRSQPQLSIQPGAAGPGGTLVFNWPASGVGFGLQTATNLAPPVIWTSLTNLPALITTNGVTRWQISLAPGTSAMRYYRLWAP
jgi:hypothetical protein